MSNPGKKMTENTNPLTSAIPGSPEINWSNDVTGNDKRVTS